MSPRIPILCIAAILASSASFAQETPQSPNQQPPVKVNVLNVCTPSAEEQKEISSALAKIPAKPTFAKDYEVARGHSTLDPRMPMPGMENLPKNENVASDWVRIRREFPNSAAFANVQYSFSTDSNTMIETLVLRIRDPKDLMQVSIDDSASAVTTAAAMLSTDTPVTRIRLERFGKSSVALARCPAEEGHPAIDQSAYEPLFRSATVILTRYREALGVRKTVPQELTRIGVGASPRAQPKSVSKPKP
ncbi:MAG TPA: hypothetical protein VMI10_23645 [Terriglobales bacterium]|nr:hypothetical protein [Terriglobales bacterium]